MRKTLVMWLGMLLCIGAGVGEAVAGTTSVGPSDDWCGTINSASPGDTVELEPGEYPDTCKISASGKKGRRITVQSAGTSESNWARFTYDGSSSNVIDLADGASYIDLKRLVFTETKDAIAAVKIKGAHHVRVESCILRKIGGVAIAANGDYGTDRSHIEVVGNEFHNLKATALYFGCHDGSCDTDSILVERNVIKNVDSDNIGYGLQVKLNSTATIRDNTVYNTKGPGIMVYGSKQGDPPSVVEGNYVEGSRNDMAILVGGGPAIVRNNVALGGDIASIGTQNYGGRDLQSNIEIVHNTLLPSDGPAIKVDNWTAGSNNVLAHNAIFSGQKPSIKPSSPAGTVRNNVVCSSLADCFEGGAGPPYDLEPVSGGPLADAVDQSPPDWMPRVDFMGFTRKRAFDIGAFRQTGRQLDREVGNGQPRPPRRKSTAGKGGDTGPGDTGTTEDATGELDSGEGDGPDGTDAPPTDTDRQGDLGEHVASGASQSQGCGCGVGGSNSHEIPMSPLLVITASFAVYVRRGRRL